MDVEFVGGGVQDPDNISASTSRLINFYRESLDGRPVLKSTLGTEAFADLNGVYTRTMQELSIGGIYSLYAINAGKLKRITSTGAVVELGNVIDSVEAAISSNNGAITAASGGRYYVYANDAMTQPTGGRLTNGQISDVAFFGQRTILVGNNREIEWTDLLAPETRDPLNFATTEASDDNNLRGVRIGGAFYVFKERSIQPFQATASGLALIPGSTIDRGLKAWGLLTIMPNGAFFVGDDNKCYIMSGGLSRPLQNRAVATALEQGEPENCIYWQDEDAEFAAIIFRDRPAWVLNISTGEWFERARNKISSWQVISAGRAFGSYFVADPFGKVSRLARTNADLDGPLIRTAVSRTMRTQGEPFTANKLEFLARVGKSEIANPVTEGTTSSDSQVMFSLNATDVTREPVIELRTSKDAGHTWSAPKARGLGKLGEFEKRINYRALGQFHRMTAEISISDPAEVSMQATATLT